MSYKHLVCTLGLCALVMVIFVVQNTSAQQYNYQTDALNEHNRLQTLHGAPPMTLDDELNRIAMTCAEYVADLGRLDHNCPAKTRNLHGENLYASSGVGYEEAVANAVKAWYNENRKYNFNNPGFDPETGHFSQLVWRSSTRFGIAAFYKDGQIWVAAIYSPAGNILGQGQFESNVLRRH